MRSIKTKGTIFVFIILLAFMFVMFPLSHGMTTRWMRGELNDSLANSATTIGKFTDDHLFQYIDPIRRLAEHPDMQSMDWEVQRQVIDNQLTVDYKELAVVSTEGTAYYTDGTTLDLSDRQYIQRVLEGEFTISETLISRVTGEQVKMIAQPIYSEEKVAGALIARIEPNFLSEFLNETNGGLYSLYFVLDREGNVKMHPDQGYITGSRDFSVIEDEQGETISSRELFESTFHEDRSHGNYRMGEEEVILAHAPLEALDWVLYIGQYEKELTEGIRLLNALYLGAGILLIFVLAGVSVFITRTFAKPVLELTAHFQQAAKGDLSVRSDVARDDELGRAGENFNRMMDKMKTLTYFDPVTKLPNQNVFEEQFQQEVKEKQKINHKNRGSGNDREMSIILLSLKGFKKVNERLGYSEGDAVLRKLTGKIQGLIPEEVKIYRGKGDEFILWNTGRKEVGDLEIFSKRLIAKAEGGMEKEKGGGTLCCHIGISRYPRDGRDSDTLIKKAAFAANHSKKLRDKKIQVFDEGLYQREIETGNLLRGIDHGLKNKEFELYYQPIYRLDTMEIKSVEALIRWNHPKEGLVSPGSFIPLAESSGKIRQVDYYVIRRAIEQIKAWEDSPCEGLVISVNLSAHTFEDPDFVPWLTDWIRKENCDPKKLQLELTERVMLEDIQQVIAKMETIWKFGCKIAIDDFGVGYSSLSYLVKLPIDQLKIDQSFTKNLYRDKGTKAVVYSLVKMGQLLNMGIIAEGIEGEQELNYLNRIHCPFGQGYFLHRPMDKMALEELFEKQGGSDY